MLGVSKMYVCSSFSIACGLAFCIGPG
jgi:hypothetical protein